MKPVAKLWYNSQGELRLLKEWIEQPIIDLGANPDGTDYAIADERVEDYERDLIRIKAESMAVVNAADVKKVELTLNSAVGNEMFFDLPGATWEEQRSRVESDEIFYAFIHLPKERGAGDNYPVTNYFEQASVPREVFRAAQDDLAAAYKRIEELGAELKKYQEMVGDAYKKIHE